MQGRTKKGTFATKRRSKARTSHAHYYGTRPKRIAVCVTRRTWALYRRALVLHRLVFPFRTRQPSEGCLSRALAEYCDWLKRKCDERGIDWKAELEGDESHQREAPEADAKRLAETKARLAAWNVDDRRPR